MNLDIDWTRCDGHGLCAALLPGPISLDEWGFPILDRSAVVDETSLRRVVAACPALALRRSTRVAAPPGIAAQSGVATQSSVAIQSSVAGGSVIRPTLTSRP
jgi:ferredoxin